MLVFSISFLDVLILLRYQDKRLILTMEDLSKALREVSTLSG